MEAERLPSQQLLFDLALLDAGPQNMLDFDGMLDELLGDDLLGSDLPLAPDGFDHNQQPQPVVDGGHVSASPADHSSDGNDFVGSSFQPSSSSGDVSLDVAPGGRGSGGGRAPARRTSTTSLADQIKKKRTRNAQQMEMNRIAQQKYRERKKAEQNQLQSAVDQLAAQLAAYKVLEVKAAALEQHNAALQGTVNQQSAAIDGLQQQVSSQAAELSQTKAALAQNQELVARQQTMILDQHAKLELQTQVIESLKEQLRSKIDDAMTCVQPGSVCEKLVAAVKAAIYGAKDQEALQSQLAKLPPDLTHEICKNIFMVVKETFPEIKAKCHALTRGADGACSVVA